MSQWSKIADPRYVPGISEFEDDMCDAEWRDTMGEPIDPLAEERSVAVVYYPDVGSPYREVITVKAADVTEECDGLLTQYLIEQRGMDHEWEYLTEATGEGWK